MLISRDDGTHVTISMTGTTGEITEFLNGAKEIERLRKKVSDLTLEVDRLRTQITRRQEYDECKKS